MITEFLNKNKYNILLILIAVIAVTIRLIHLLNNSMFYGDEVNLLNNVKLLGYKELIKGLDSVQASPPVFLIISKFVYELFKNSSSYTLDLYLRIFPFICGIISLVLFYIFDKKIFENKTQRLIAFLIFAINTQTIAYCTIFKQYTLELLTALALYIIAYDIVFKNKIKWYHPVIMLSSIWFSYSSCFILLPLCIYILIKQKQMIIQMLLPLAVSFAVFYETSFKYVLSSSYHDLINCWNGLEFGYLSIFHPCRTFIRVGEFFLFGASTPHKIATIICGIIILYAMITYLFSKENSNIKKGFIITPIILTAIASLLHKYPVVARLTLFLYPLITVILAGYNYKFKRIFITLICICAVATAIYYTPKPSLPDNNSRNIIEYQKGYLDLTSREDCIVNY